MIEVFFCHLGNPDPLRAAMSNLCLQRWSKEVTVDIHLVSPQRLGCSDRDFQRQRRIYADKHSDLPIYIVADDDCLLPANFNLSAAIEKVREYAGFSTLSSLPSNCVINRWTPEGYPSVFNGDVMEHVSAGGIRFCRRGHLKQWPMMLAEGPPSYDWQHAEAIRSAGSKVGYLRNFTHIHLGEGHSTVWR